jgi:acetolactate synthase-1/2/3 large subunit
LSYYRCPLPATNAALDERVDRVSWHAQMKLSDYVFNFLADEGIRHIFMLPGGGAMHLNDSVGTNERLEYVCMLHEQAAAIAAEAYSRVAGDLGVVLVTAGPGGTNTVTGVTAAWLDSTPCLFISGQVKRADSAIGTSLRQKGVQEVDIVSIVRSITKYAVTVKDPRQIRFHLGTALQLARSGRPGPVWLDIPLDVQAAEIDTTTLLGATPLAHDGKDGPSDLRESVDKIIKSLNTAERPVILIGNGVRIARAEHELSKLLNALNIPILTTRLGVDLVPASQPLLVGMPGGIASRAANFTLQNSDFLLILGARLDMALIAYAPERLARGATKVMINIDRAEIEKLDGIIDIPVVADAKAFISEMLAASGSLKKRDRSPWLSRIADWKSRYPFVLPEQRVLGNAITTYAFSAILAEEMGKDDIFLPGSSGFACEIALTAFSVKPGQRVFHNKGTGAMGLQQPAAIGAAIAGKGRRTVVIDGDGGFQMNIQELETVRRLGLPIKFFVIDNGGYASIRSSQLGYFKRLTGADMTSGMTLPDVLKVASAYDLPTIDIIEPARLRDCIREALASPGPVVCRVVVPHDEPRMPRVASMQRPDGSMVSKPLEDMWPFLSREEFMANMIVEPIDE